MTKVAALGLASRGPQVPFGLQPSAFTLQVSFRKAISPSPGNTRRSMEGGGAPYASPRLVDSNWYCAVDLDVQWSVSGTVYPRVTVFALTPHKSVLQPAWVPIAFRNRKCRCTDLECPSLMKAHEELPALPAQPATVITFSSSVLALGRSISPLFLRDVLSTSFFRVSGASSGVMTTSTMFKPLPS